jgi:hypothetical protein
LPAKSDAKRLNTMDVSVLRLTSGEVERRLVTVPVGRFFVPMSQITDPIPGRPALEIRYPGSLVADYKPRHDESDPPGYTPILSQWDIVVPVDPAYRAGTYKKLSDVDDTLRRQRTGGPIVKNLPVLDPLPDCGPRAGDTCSNQDNCTKIGLSCNPTTCQCDAPQVAGYGEYCAPGVVRCKTRIELTPEERAFAPNGYICHARTPRGVCYPQCNAGDPNLSAWRTDGVFDSRCGDIPGYTCQTPREGTTSDGNANSVCLRACSLRLGTAKVTETCSAPARVRLPNPKSGAIEERNIADGLGCVQGVRGLEACIFDETYLPR